MRHHLLLGLGVVALVQSMGCKRDCDAKGGPLSSDERGWFVEPAGDTVTYIEEGGDSVLKEVPRTAVINNMKGQFEREERCEWGYEAGAQVVANGISVEVEHYGVGVEGNLNSARIYGLHLSDHPAQNGVVVNGHTYNGVNVLPGNTSSYVHDILFSKEEGLIAFTRDGIRWLRQP